MSQPNITHIGLLRAGRVIANERGIRHPVEERFDRMAGMDGELRRLLQAAFDLCGEIGVERLQAVVTLTDERSVLHPVDVRWEREAVMDGTLRRRLQAAHDLDAALA